MRLFRYLNAGDENLQLGRGGGEYRNAVSGRSWEKRKCGGDILRSPLEVETDGMFKERKA